IDAAEWLLMAQHNYFAGMLAHCAVRIGEHVPDAVAVIEAAQVAAGGGLLHLVLRHGEATLSGDARALGTLADEATELGMMATAADTRLACDQLTGARRSGGRDSLQPQDAGARSRADGHSMALWHSL